MSSAMPNILLITADQLRYDCVEPNKDAVVRTPILSQLAKDGVRFTRAFSHIPICGPSRQSLLCGKRPEAFGALWNAGSSLPIASLDPASGTWPQTLAGQGYRSVFLGKWGVHPEHDPTSFGYETYISEADYAAFRKASYPDVTYTNGYFGETNPIPVEASSTHWFANQAIDQLRGLCGSGQPWHMALHFSEPHLPCRPSGRFASMYDAAGLTAWPSFWETFEGKPYIQKQQLSNWGIEQYTWDDWAPVVARYYGTISQLDEAIGLVLHALEDFGAADNTLVIFTSDHGDLCGAHRMMDKHYVMYDDVVHVPMIVRWNGVVPAGTICDDFVYNFLDLPPTLLESIGLTSSERDKFHGISLLSRLTDPEQAHPRRDAVISTYNGQQFGLYCQRMLRNERYKYIWNLTDVDELYDLESDPAELHNRIHDPEHVVLLRELRAQLYEELRQWDGFDNEWMRRQLLEGKKVALR